MRRLRVLRVLLPFALLLFLVLLAFQVKPPPKVHTETPGKGSPASETGQGLTGHQSVDGRSVLDFVADLFENLPDGSMRFRGIESFKVYRVGRGPLEVSAEEGNVSGEPGSRVMRFASRVTIRDPEAGLELSLPALRVDEEAGEARSGGEVTLSGPEVRGTASELVYGLEDQPSVLYEVDFSDTQGGRLQAREAWLHDGLDDVEFRGEVRGRRGEEFLEVDRLRLQRGPGQRPRRARGSGQARAAMLGPGAELMEFRGAEFEQDWDADGQPTALRLQGDAEIRSGTRTIAAESIEARREDRDGSWSVDAEGTVYVQGLFSGQPTWLRAESLHADVDADHSLRRATINEAVRIDSPMGRAEAERASVLQLGAGHELRLFGDSRRKARLARERTRVAAVRITTDAAGSRLLAEESVEATLLPATASAEAPALSGLFQVGEAVHFVAARLKGEQDGSRLHFEGAVRGWQGDRNLAAETVDLDQNARSLLARGHVTSRLPRDSQALAVSEADYIQVSADRLAYAEASRRAVYEGSVRVRLVEGWLEAQRVEVDLDPAGRGIAEVRAYESVTIEFRDTAEDTLPRMITGKADRLVFTPPDQLVVLFGEREPASVRRIGQGGETTRGRVLRYRLDSGALDVDSGGIRTSEK